MNTENGSLYYDIKGDNSQFVGAIKESERQVKGFSNAVLKESGNLDKSLQEMNKSVIKSVRNQIVSLDSLNSEIDKVFKSLMKATSIGNNKEADILTKRLSELKSKRDEVAKAHVVMAEKQKEMVVQNVKEESSIGRVTKSLGNWVTGLFTAGFALNAIQRVIASSGDLTDWFARIMVGAKTATEYFFKSIASGDWSNFLSGMDKAIKAGVEYEKVMSSIQNRRNEALINESEIDIKIGKLREATYDKEDENNLKRLQKLDEIEDLTRQKYDEKIKLETDSFNATVTSSSYNKTL